MSNSYDSAQKAIAVFQDGLMFSFIYCPIVMTLHRKRSLCFRIA
ncbi:hypothetical protein [Okeania sp. SIO2C2]|nr:hypothetical protein [Okeania sp. SIO2C2]